MDCPQTNRLSRHTVDWPRWLMAGQISTNSWLRPSNLAVEYLWFGGCRNCKRRYCRLPNWSRDVDLPNLTWAPRSNCPAVGGRACRFRNRCSQLWNYHYRRAANFLDRNRWTLFDSVHAPLRRTLPAQHFRNEPGPCHICLDLLHESSTAGRGFS